MVLARSLRQAASFLRRPIFSRSRTMANNESQDKPQHPEQQPATSTPEQDQKGGTFKTDVSETDDEGTTVRDAEVREDDLSEVDPSKETGHE